MTKTNKKKDGSIQLPKIKQGEWVLHVTRPAGPPVERCRNTLCLHRSREVVARSYSTVKHCRHTVPTAPPDTVGTRSYSTLRWRRHAVAHCKTGADVQSACTLNKFWLTSQQEGLGLLENEGKFCAFFHSNSSAGVWISCIRGLLQRRWIRQSASASSH